MKEVCEEIHRQKMAGTAPAESTCRSSAAGATVAAATHAMHATATARATATSTAPAPARSPQFGHGSNQHKPADVDGSCITQALE